MKKIIFILMIVSVLFAGRNTPKDEMPDGHINGAEVSWVNGYTINIGVTNQVSTLKDSGNNWDWTFTNALVVNLTNSNASGAYGGLARGITLASNTVYYVYVVFKTTKPYSNLAYGMATTNATAPEFLDESVKTNIDSYAGTTNYYTNRTTMSYRKVGSFVTWDTNSTVQAVPFVQSGSGRIRDVSLSSSVTTYGQIASNGGAETAWATSSTIGYVPDFATAVYLDVAMTNGIGSLCGAPPIMSASGINIDPATTALKTESVVLPIKSQKFYYKVSAGSMSAYVVGWKEEL